VKGARDRDAFAEFSTYGKDTAMTSLALLLVRLMIGLGLAAHGAQKGFGWFGGKGFKATGNFFESLGYRPGSLFVGLAVTGEVAGGVLTAAGLFGPAGPALIILVMIVAAGTIHLKNGFFSQNGGYELNALYSVAALALAFAGPGNLSLDAAFGIRTYFTETVNAVTIAAGMVFGFINLGLRRPTTA
jgi:putative oxidoreductase